MTVLLEQPTTDVVTSRQEASAPSTSPEMHHAVIAIMQRIHAAKNGVRDATKT